jgi:hypothetical protein
VVETQQTNADTCQVKSRGRGPARRAFALALALAAPLALAPGAAQAARTAPSAKGLSPRLAKLSRPSLRSASRGRQARELSLPRSGPGSLLRRGGRVLATLRFESGAAAAVPELRAAGAEVVDVNRSSQRATVAVAPADLGTLAAVPRVASVKEVLRPLLFAEEECPSGLVVSEGYEQLRVKQAGEQFPGVDGSGVKVGILSDSFHQAVEAGDGSGPPATDEKADVENGDLPGTGNPCGDTTKVQNLEEFKPQPGEEGGFDEGRGMAQIVHDLAPGADLAFATAFNGEEKFASNIEDLAKAGAGVIVDDVAYLEEPFFQEGPVGVAARKVTEAGALYFSAAGNDNLVDSAGREIASWEAPSFRDSGGCPGALVAVSEAFEEEEGPGTGLRPTHCMDFDASKGGVDRTFGITVAPGATLLVDLQWAEPWEGVETDIDAYLFDSAGNLISGSAEDNVFTTKQPVEIFGWENESTTKSARVDLVVNRYEGAGPRLKLALMQNGGGVSAVEYPESRGGDVVGPSVFGHSGDPATISVGAVPFNDSSEPEEYSSRGPATHYFGPVEGKTAAAALPSPEVISKPDLAATDCGKTSFFYFQDALENWRFCGTSAAAPHAAAVAALALDSVEAPTPETPAEVREAEINSAADVGQFSTCAVGGGLVDAVATIEALQAEDLGTAPAPCEPPESPPISEPPPTTSTVTPPQEEPPDTLLRKHPRKVVRTHGRRAKAVFVFAAEGSASGFECRVDRGHFHECPRRFVRRYKPGRHVLRVRAVGPGGTDPTPAVFRFRVKKIAKSR